MRSKGYAADVIEGCRIQEIAGQILPSGVAGLQVDSHIPKLLGLAVVLGGVAGEASSCSIEPIGINLSEFWANLE
jgi:hypothetical protein